MTIQISMTHPHFNIILKGSVYFANCIRLSVFPAIWAMWAFWRYSFKNSFGGHAPRSTVSHHAFGACSPII